MKHIDITFDLETCATTANAAVMQVAAVVWNRYAGVNPFEFSNSHLCDDETTFNEFIDLRTCVVAGMDFDPETIAWWSHQGETAKRDVCAGLPEPVNQVFADFVQWVADVKKKTGADSVFLWCQGMDFDIAILKNACRKFGIKTPIDYRCFRDARTVILEDAIRKAEEGGLDVTDEDILANPSKAYELYYPLPSCCAQGHEAHDALYDCLRTAWNTWQALNL